MKVFIGRRIGAVIAGLMGGVITVGVVESLGHQLFPVAPELDLSKPELLEAYIQNLPMSAMLFVILAWAAGAFVGGSLSTFVSRDQKPTTALICGSILMIFGVINLMMIPHPLWFWFLGVGVYLPFAWLGFKISVKKKIDGVESKV